MLKQAGSDEVTFVIVYSVTVNGTSVKSKLPVTSVNVNGEPGLASISMVRGYGVSVMMVNVAAPSSHIAVSPSREIEIIGSTSTSITSIFGQLTPSLTVTLYIPAVLTIVVGVVAPFDHSYSSLVALASSVVNSPSQISISGPRSTAM